MGGNVYNPMAAGQTQTGMNSGASAMQPWGVTDQGLGDGYGTNVETGITTGAPQVGGSSFMDMFSGGNKGFQSSFMGQLPGYILGGLSYVDQKKTNDLNRKSTKYALDRKQTEDKAYDKYKSDWSKMSFA